jgi:hypothetical protein
MKTLLLSFVALVALSPLARAEHQKRILTCSDPDLKHPGHYELVYMPIQKKYLFVQRLPMIPYQRQVWLSTSPMLYAKGLEIKEETKEGHIYLYQTKEEGNWYLDVSIGEIKAGPSDGWLCRYRPGGEWP